MTIKDFSVGDEVYILDQRFTKEPRWTVAKVTKVGRKYITVDWCGCRFCDAFGGRTNYLISSDSASDHTTSIRLFKCDEEYNNYTQKQEYMVRIRSLAKRLDLNTITLDRLQRILAIMEEP